MKTWKITTRFTPEHAEAAQLPPAEAAAPQEQHVTDDLPDEDAVRAYVAENWAHMEFVSAQEVVK